MPAPTPSRLDDERLADLIYLREQMIKLSGGDSFDGLDTLDAFRELQQRRAAESAEAWVPWNCNSSPPPERGRWYWTSKVSRRGKQAFSEEECFFGEPDECWKDGWHSSWIVLAYWPRPLPPPYAHSSPDGEKGR